MKGVLNIEFIVSVIVFLITLSFVSMSIINNAPFLHQESFIENLKSNAYQVSQLLLLDEGLSDSGNTNWNKDNVVLLGLSAGEEYILDQNKISELDNLCNEDYEKVRGLLADYKTYITLSIIRPDGSQILDCRPEEKKGITSVVKRHAVVNGEVVRFDISVIGI